MNASSSARSSRPVARWIASSVRKPGGRNRPAADWRWPRLLLRRFVLLYLRWPHVWDDNPARPASKRPASPSPAPAPPHPAPSPPFSRYPHPPPAARSRIPPPRCSRAPPSALPLPCPPSAAAFPRTLLYIKSIRMIRYLLRPRGAASCGSPSLPAIQSPRPARTA